MKIIRQAVLDMDTLNWVSEESYDYDGPVDLCCGATGGQESLASGETSLSTELGQDFGTRFQQQGQTLTDLGGILQGVQEGKLLPGFSASTDAALNTAAIDTTAGNFKNAQIATNDANAARGGDSGLESGTEAQENETVASQAAGQLSSEQQKIQLANQAQAEQNTSMALGGESTLAGLENPQSFAGAATQANSTAYGEDTQNATEGAQEFADIAGGISGIAQAGLKAIPGFSGPSSGGQMTGTYDPSMTDAQADEADPYSMENDASSNPN